ncbi:hypothetical protein B0J18DRAFT_435123 [Chaetomium sp. MPI-SDFR-AT-0129]|nr:hypothetical protein B0J18DRAFT_435123 [Chaetomium sp. MPI-SDFR-AT-0129]
MTEAALVLNPVTVLLHVAHAQHRGSDLIIPLTAQHPPSASPEREPFFSSWHYRLSARYVLCIRPIPVATKEKRVARVDVLMFQIDLRPLRPSTVTSRGAADLPNPIRPSAAHCFLSGGGFTPHPKLLPPVFNEKTSNLPLPKPSR